MTHGFVAMGDGCRIAYRFDGPSDAPVLLLSNSLGTAMGMWAPQLPAFTRDYRVLRYDSRGHGASDAPAGGYAMDRLGRDVVELADALQLARFHFCGLSLGGMVGQWLGILEPDRLINLILANTSGYMGPPSGWDARIAAALGQGMAPLAEASVTRWFTPGFAARDRAAIRPVEAMLLATDPVGYAGCCAAIRDMDMRRTATLIDAPTLVIGGAQDPATPAAHGEALAAAIAGARLTMLDAAHLSNVEQPEAFAQAVLDHIAGG
ncbi:MAG: 3-oxoadipate enol-lactonase [Sphingomonas sp. SCN 67-18]|uniref:3-oxoadipate enol-lactonase n=1 Tax=uncultured Sphingomonas sp. TaxID=158754 RepID=UPI00086DB1A5|nr:3-oxoadipate enol-lactonase [Sphingomonas sp. SCN 67-18]ODU21685.1 MAG: 3-oxoadipate enol-lactonase [Sphingomonas sp. SCN 67-18]